MPEQEPQLLNARCLCEAHNITLPIPKTHLPLKASVCHCNSCRRNFGTLYICAALLPSETVTAISSSTILDSLKTYNWSIRKSMYFCGKCGTHIFEKTPQEFWINTGCLEQLENMVQVQKQICVKDTIDGGFSSWLKTWDGHAIKSYATATQELFHNKSLESRTEKDFEDRLHAHCLCNGINFWISRPSASSANTSAPLSDSLKNSSNNGSDQSWWLRHHQTKFLSNVCACNSCRLASGADFVQWAFIPASDISLSVDGDIPFSHNFGTLQAFRSSEQATRYFCRVCGASVFWTGDMRPGLIDVAVGLLDAKEGSRAESWLEWATERISFREDAEIRARTLVDHVEQSLNEWGRIYQT